MLIQMKPVWIIVLCEEVQAIKKVPMGIDANIPLIHEWMDPHPSCRYNHCTTVTSILPKPTALLTLS
jgi:hypothetical protein